MRLRSSMQARAWRRFPQTCVALALGGGAIACSGGNFAGGDQAAETDPPDSLHGELKVYVATFGDGREETHFALQTSSGDERPLLFSQPPTVSPGTSIRVWATPPATTPSSAASASALEVSSWEVAARALGNSAEVGSQSEPLTTVTPLPSRRMCVVMVDVGSGFGRLTSEAVDQSFFTGPKSVDAFYRENSYGKTGLDGHVYGPFTYKMSTCDTQGMARAMRANITDTCDQYAYVFSQTTLCGWGGLGAVGTPDQPASDTWYNGSVSCVVAVQEPGHNYGMAHSSSMACKTATFANDPSTSCTHNEYGDHFDPMGGACRHMNVWQKEYEQWYGGCNSVKVTASGTFNLLPTELACDGVQALQIAMPMARTYTRPAGGGSAPGTDSLTSYYLEYRTSAGFDTGMAPTVLLHVGGDYRNGRRQAGMHTWLLDMHPGGAAGFNDAGFKAGETFTDPAGGLTITVESMDADKAVVRVDRTNGAGEPTCMDGTTFTAPGIASCGTAPPPPPDDGGVTAVPPSMSREAGVADAGAPRNEAATVPAPVTRDAAPSATEPSVPETGAAPPDGGSAPNVVGHADADVELGTSLPRPAASGPPSDVVGGCSCRVADRRSRGPNATVGAVGLALAIGLSRRARRRKPTARVS